MVDVPWKVLALYLLVDSIVFLSSNLYYDFCSFIPHMYTDFLHRFTVQIFVRKIKYNLNSYSKQFYLYFFNFDNTFMKM